MVFRPDDNAIAEILRERHSEHRRYSAEASKTVGAATAERIRELAKRRNEAARALGRRDHFALALETTELDEHRLFATLDAVDAATEAPFRAWKGALDDRLAARFGCAAGELLPWHYDDAFFQSAPTAAGADLDWVFDDRDLESLTLRTYEGLGLDVAPVLDRSDLYPRAAKNQHAFCIDVDRAGDVRVLCNVTASERWMETMLHEFGHGTYFAEVDRDLPWLMRTMHSLTTEGIAMLFGRLARDSDWLATVAGVDQSEVARRSDALRDARRAQLLVFRPLGARDDQLRARSLRRSRRRSRRPLVGPRRALPTPAPPTRSQRSRLGREDPPRGGARLLPELPLRRAVRVAGRRHAPARARWHRRP